jgi:transcriptional regulator with XRE-family HTH domain
VQLAEMVRAARKAKGLSQGAVARRLTTEKKPRGVWPTYVGQIEKGEKVPSDEVCLKLAEVLELETRQVLLAAYAARAESAEAGALFLAATESLAAAALQSEPALDQDLGESLSPELRQMLRDPELKAALAQPRLQSLLLQVAQAGAGRDFTRVLARLQAMDDRQWISLLNVLEAMGV